MGAAIGASLAIGNRREEAFARDDARDAAASLRHCERRAGHAATGSPSAPRPWRT